MSACEIARTMSLFEFDEAPCPSKWMLSAIRLTASPTTSGFKKVWRSGEEGSVPA